MEQEYKTKVYNKKNKLPLKDLLRLVRYEEDGLIHELYLNDIDNMIIMVCRDKENNDLGLMDSVEFNCIRDMGECIMEMRKESLIKDVKRGIEKYKTYLKNKNNEVK